MAVDLGKLVAEAKQTIAFEELAGKDIAIDAYNTIYQFLSIIRQPDGTPLTDAKGRVTSHLSGLFYRTANLIGYGIRPLYVFDGIPSQLKRKTLEARMSRRAEALEAWEKAKEEGKLEEARQHAMASTRINKEIVQSSKELLGYMGIPYLQAPGEGEAQASYLVRKGLSYAIASQDYDSLLFGANVVIRNFTISGRRKLPKKQVYVEVGLERIFLDDLLARLGIGRKQLILLGMLVGTDFNPGIERIGPKTALKIVTENRDLESIVRHLKLKYGAEFEADPQEVLSLFENPEVREIEKREFEELTGRSSANPDSIVRFMCAEHGFSEERIRKFAERLSSAKAASAQKGIGNWM